MKRTKTTLKSYFQTGDKPKQTEYENLIDSFWHLDDSLPLVNLDENIAKKNEDNNFSTLQTFDDNVAILGDLTVDTGLITANAGIRINQILNTPGDTDLKIVPHGIGNIHFGNSGDGNKLFHYSQLNDGKYTSFYHNTSESVFDTTCSNGFSFEKNVTINGVININQTIETPTDTNLAIIPNGTGNVYFGSSTNGNNIYHYSRYNDGNYTTFSHNSTQSLLSTTSSDGFLFSNEVEFSGNTKINGNLVLNSPKVQFLTGSTEWEIYPSGDDLYFRDTTNGFDLVRFNPNEVEIKKPLEVTVADANRYVKFKAPNGENRFDFYVGGSGNAAYLNLFDQDGTTIKTRINSVGASFFGGDLSVDGDIQTSGNYKSSDGTPGYNGNFTVGVYDITVKDGLITNVVNIS